MKKVIRLSESDLMRIVKRIVNESTLTEQDSPKTIKGFLKSTKPGERGKPTNDFVVIKLGDNMRYGNYENSVITQSNANDSRIKSGTKGTIGKIDKQNRKCEFIFNNPSYGKIELVNIELNKSPHLY
jgi:hypothetical protein